MTYQKPEVAASKKIQGSLGIEDSAAYSVKVKKPV